jgi:flagellar protein FlgJ
MQIAAIADLYYQNAGLRAAGFGDGLSAAAAGSGSAAGYAEGGAGAAFGQLVQAAAKAQASATAAASEAATVAASGRPSAAGRPLGEAANSGSVDASRAGKPKSVDRDSPLYAQCRELETFLMKNLLKSMRATVEKSGLTDSGFAGQMYEDMLYDEYAANLSKTAGFGLADQAYLELSGQRRYA